MSLTYAPGPCHVHVIVSYKQNNCFKYRYTASYCLTLNILTGFILTVDIYDTLITVCVIQFKDFENDLFFVIINIKPGVKLHMIILCLP